MSVKDQFSQIEIDNKNLENLVGPLPKPQDFGEHGSKITDSTLKMAEGLRKSNLRDAAEPTLREFITKIEAEERRDVEVDVSQLTVHNGDELDCFDWVADKQPAVGLNSYTLKQLTNTALHSKCEHNTNKPMMYLLGGWMGDCNRKVTIGARRRSSESARCEAYRINPTSNRGYTPYEVDKVARHLLETATPGAQARVRYNRETTRWSIELYLQNPWEVEELGVGMVHRAGVILRGDDRGGMSLTGAQRFERVACMNGMIVPTQVAGFKVKHSGDIHRIQRAVDRCIHSTEVVMRMFSDKWSESFRTQIHGDYDGTPVGAEECFRRLIAHKLVKVPGVNNQKLMGYLMNAWEHEPGDTKGHVINAVTRLHEQKDIPWYALEDEVEETAGEMLWQRNMILKPLSKAQERAW